jgi:hypothetical protein
MNNIIIKIIYIIFLFFIIILLFYLLNNLFIINEHFNTNNKKYNISLCCIIKDERYLEEFIIYYSIIGVEHFYIYDNESNIPIKDRLSNDYFKNICTIIDFPGKVQQLNAYNNCLEKYGNETKWLIFVDGDEYILPKKHDNLKNFLNDYDDAYAIGINWIMFGSSFHEKKQDGFLIDKYRMCNKSQNPHIKTIVKPEYTIKMTDPHTAELTDNTKYMDSKKNIIHGPFNQNETVDIIQINHYHGKSYEEQLEKKKRGTPDTEKNVYVPQAHNINNNETDNLIVDKYFNQLQNIAHSINYKI